MLLAGFLHGMNLFPVSAQNTISKFTGSLSANFEITDNKGFADDAKKLMGDWSMVKGDILESFEKAAHESEQA